MKPNPQQHQRQCTHAPHEGGQLDASPTAAAPDFGNWVLAQTHTRKRGPQDETSTPGYEWLGSWEAGNFKTEISVSLIPSVVSNEDNLQPVVDP